MSNPFATINHRGRGMELEAMSVEDRLDMICRFDIEQCADALELPDLQATVRKALWRRAKVLLREEGLDLRIEDRSQGG